MRGRLLLRAIAQNVPAGDDRSPTPLQTFLPLLACRHCRIAWLFSRLVNIRDIPLRSVWPRFSIFATQAIAMEAIATIATAQFGWNAEERKYLGNQKPYPDPVGYLDSAGATSLALTTALILPAPTLLSRITTLSALDRYRSNTASMPQRSPATTFTRCRGLSVGSANTIRPFVSRFLIPVIIDSATSHGWPPVHTRPLIPGVCVSL
jgi:hypothetical protein